MESRCVSGPITEAIITEAHEGIAGGHFAENITLHKILTAFYWWPTMKRDVCIYIANNATYTKEWDQKYPSHHNHYIQLCLRRCSKDGDWIL